ncbi:ATP-dependent DNA ligase clustered with Ku protein, LigD [Alloactinosynnema sp. L-07]|uniref:ATP-dependent DNA ligase n=1 Tax=Alloactinosynnema sp. L-07 TaxID=1653480 RepID=UPI00065EF2E2|nr:hypothetical protein [Alloactinosynnema sp. L-07]CRK56894.1 ATP-dependent DNA ligase clustered with Ku protein, LigD [Alloactinosynnema sp. L-07]
MAVLGPPVGLALARSLGRLPAPDPARLALEPKFDGWRGALFAMAGVLQSRRDNDLAARFPEIIRAGAGLGDVVLDGEIVALREGRLDFGSLTVAPARRADLGVVIYYVAFDVLAVGEDDLRVLPYGDRRARLEELFAGAAPPLQLAPSVRGMAEALAWMEPEQAVVGIEGVIIKDVRRPYRPGRTGDWLKVRQTRLVDAVVIGVTGSLARPLELVLARPDESGERRWIGLSQPLPPKLRDQAGQHVRSTGESPRRVSGGGFGQPSTEYLPVHADPGGRGPGRGERAELHLPAPPARASAPPRPDPTVEDLG